MVVDHNTEQEQQELRGRNTQTQKPRHDHTPEPPKRDHHNNGIVSYLLTWFFRPNKSHTLFPYHVLEKWQKKNKFTYGLHERT